MDSQKHLISQFPNKPLEILKVLRGYYSCPKDKEGKRLGPMVGYAAKYDAADGSKKQYVGDKYINFSIAEQYPIIMQHFAKLLLKKIKKRILLAPRFQRVCGPEKGGFNIGTFLALEAKTMFAYIEKKVTALATETLREQSQLALLRHSLNPGEWILITEDVLNNFATTEESIDVIEATGAEVVGIVGLLNRSPSLIKNYKYCGRSIPVIALIEQSMLEWKQEDPEVTEDMAKGNVVLKPKNEWHKFRNVMDVHQ